MLWTHLLWQKEPTNKSRAKQKGVRQPTLSWKMLHISTELIWTAKSGDNLVPSYKSLFKSIKYSPRYFIGLSLWNQPSWLYVCAECHVLGGWTLKWRRTIRELKLTCKMSGFRSQKGHGQSTDCDCSETWHTSNKLGACVQEEAEAAG